MLWPHNAAEARMAGRCVHGLGVPGGGAVAPAIVGSAEERASLQHLPGDADIRRLWVVAPGNVSLTGIDAHRAGAAATFDFMVVQVPIDGPLPHVAGHVVQTVSVRWERPDR